MFKKSLFTIVLSIVLLSACTTENNPVTNDAQDQKNSDDPIKIVTTFPPLYSFTKNIVGELGDVSNIVAPGTSVHTWEPKASNLKAIAQADLLVMNGLGLEPFIQDMIESAQNPTLSIVVTSDAVSENIMDGPEVIELEEGHGHEEEHEEEHHEEHEQEEHKEEEHEHDEEHDETEHNEHEEEHEEESHDHHHEGPDPHIWLNPGLAIHQVEAIRDAIIKIDPNNAATYTNNANSYLNNLKALDDQIRSDLSKVSAKPFIVFHDAYSYYFEQYGLTENRKAAIEPFPGKSPSAAYFQELVELIKNEGVEIIFTEPQFNPQTVQNLEEETAIKTFEIDPIGLELSAEGYQNNSKALTVQFLAAFES